MTRLEALKELVTKVEAGEFPHGADGAARVVFPYHAEDARDMGLMAAAAFDGSLDAALALHEAVLPGWAVDLHERIVGDGRRDGWSAVVTDLSGSFWTWETGSDVGAWHKDAPARAWLLAILRALIAQEQQQ